MTDGPTPTRRSRRSSGVVTLHDVAKLAGVAPITASRALNTPERVSAEVLARVREAVSRTGYVPNRLAGGLASARSRLVAAIVPTVSGLVFLETVRALTETLAVQGYQMLLGQSGYEGIREDALVEAIIGQRPDGIVLTGVFHSAEARRRLLAAEIPVVETWDLTPTPIDMLIGFSHEEVGRGVARFLHARGRRRVAAVSGNDPRARRRYGALLAECTRLGLATVPAFEVPTPTTLRGGRTGLAHLLDRPDPPDAVFCSSDHLALGVLTEARVRGLRVPHDLSVVGFGDLEFAADVEPAITTVHIQGAEIGRLAAQCIVDRATGRGEPPRITDIGFSIVERASA